MSGGQDVGSFRLSICEPWVVRLPVLQRSGQQSWNTRSSLSVINNLKVAIIDANATRHVAETRHEHDSRICSRQ